MEELNLIVSYYAFTTCKFQIFLIVVSSQVIVVTVPVPLLDGIMTLPSVNNTTLNVTWQPPVNQNGNITHYNVDVRNRKFDFTQFPFYNYLIDHIDGEEYYTLLVKNLG